MNEPAPRTLETTAGERFELHPIAGGHERVFVGRWTWRDAVPWTEEQIAAKVRLGVWRVVRGKDAARP